MNRFVCIKTEKKHILNKLCEEYKQSYSIINVGDFVLAYKFDDKLVFDNFVYKNMNYVYLFEGINTNSRQFYNNSFDSVESFINNSCNDDSIYFKYFSGPFCGLKYSIPDDKLYLYTNQLGESFIFYYYHNDVFISSNDFNLIVDIFKSLHINYSINETAIDYMLTFGWMLDDSTIINEIKRLEPGNYLLQYCGKIEINEYFRFKYVEDARLSLVDSVYLLNEYFNKSIKKIFNKSLSYNYKYHLCNLSGGLDSRMVNFAAKENGFTNIVNINYCQSNSDEYKYASNVASFLKNQFLHKQLDDATFFYDLDEIVSLNYGLTLYDASTGLNQMLKLLNKNMFAFEVTGQIGDVVVGSFTNLNYYEKNINKLFKSSNTLNIDVDNKILEKFNCNEEFLMYTRGFRGVLTTNLIRRKYFYSISPFTDIDFYQICMNIPMKFRKNHILYWAWIKKFYPDAYKIKSTRHISLFNNKYYSKLNKIFHCLLKNIGLTKSEFLKNSMNPYNYWFDTNYDLRSFILEYYNTNKYLIEDKNFYISMKKCFESKTMSDKLLVLTVLGSIKRYFQ